MFPLLAAKFDFTEVFGTIVLVISVLGWFVNVIQSNSANAAARPKNPNPKPQQTGRSEIETLLKELTGDKRKPKSEATPEAKKVPSQPRQSKPQNERRQKPNQAGSRGAQKPPVPARSMPRSTEATLPSAHLGDGIRTHQLGNRVDAAVQKEITATVQQDLGKGLAVPALTVLPVHPLVAVLQNPQGVRQAILLNEVLQRPKGLRHL